jgi:hypothetical protein
LKSFTNTYGVSRVQSSCGIHPCWI